MAGEMTGRPKTTRAPPVLCTDGARGVRQIEKLLSLLFVEANELTHWPWFL